MGLGGLLQALTAARPIARERGALHAQRRLVLLGGLAVAVYPLAFYTSMRLAGVAVGTVVSIGSGPLASALAGRILDRNRLTARWLAGAALGLAGMVPALPRRSRPAAPRPRVRRRHAARRGPGPGRRDHLRALYLGRPPPDRPRRFHPGHHGRGFGLGGLLLLPVLLATGAPLVASWTNAGVGVYMALVPMFTGYLLFGWALAHVPVTTVTTLTLLEPAVATVLAVTIVGEHLPAAGWAGLALVAGCLVVLTAPRRAAPARNKRVDLPAAGGLRVAGMAGGEFLTIGELARAAGLTAKTVRFWSDQGLLPPAGPRPATGSTTPGHWPAWG